MAQNQGNIPSTTFNEGMRGNIAKANIANENLSRLECKMEELILDSRMDEHGEINEDDLKELLNQGERMVRSKKTRILKQPTSAITIFGMTTSAGGT